MTEAQMKAAMLEGIDKALDAPPAIVRRGDKVVLRATKEALEEDPSSDAFVSAVLARMPSRGPDGAQIHFQVEE
jgi:hypothetical protein